jgi:hypothetical protein
MLWARLVLGGETFRVENSRLVKSCQRFEDDPFLLSGPYAVGSDVSTDSFRTFVDAIGGTSPEITTGNVIDLILLSKEFGFKSLMSKISEFRSRYSSFEGLNQGAIESLIAEGQRQQAELDGVRSELAELRHALRRAREESESLTESNGSLTDQIALKRRNFAAFRSAPRRPEPTKSDLREGVRRKFYPHQPMQGIIYALAFECGRNVHDGGVVVVTSSAPYSDSAVHRAQNAADIDAPSCFQSQYRLPSESIADEPNNWICYDFKVRLVGLTHYAIRSKWDGGFNGQNPKSWIVEISPDGIQWTEIDARRDTEVLNGRDLIHVFAVQTAAIGRFVRLSNVGRNHHGTDALVISAFELFGTLFE